MSEDLSIAINSVSHPILCGSCHGSIAFVGEGDLENGKAGCLPCDNVANVQDVAQMAIEYAKDEGQLLLNRAAREVARQTKIMKFSGQTEHDKVHRFVVELKL